MRYCGHVSAVSVAPASATRRGRRRARSRDVTCAMCRRTPTSVAIAATVAIAIASHNRRARAAVASAATAPKCAEQASFSACTTQGRPVVATASSDSNISPSSHRPEPGELGLASRRGEIVKSLKPIAPASTIASAAARRAEHGAGVQRDVEHASRSASARRLPQHLGCAARRAGDRHLEDRRDARAAAAAAVSLPNVPRSGWLGARQWKCTSIAPGRTCRPVASISSPRGPEPARLVELDDPPALDADVEQRGCAARRRRRR